MTPPIAIDVDCISFEQFLIIRMSTCVNLRGGEGVCARGMIAMNHEWKL